MIELEYFVERFEKRLAFENFEIVQVSILFVLDLLLQICQHTCNQRDKNDDNQQDLHDDQKVVKSESVVVFFV